MKYQQNILGYGLWLHEEGFYSIEGWCRNPSHAEVRADLAAIRGLAHTKRLPKGVQTVRFFTAKHSNKTVASKTRQWEIISRSGEPT